MKFIIFKYIPALYIPFMANICVACTCSNSPGTFIKYINKNNVIFAAEVIEQIDLPDSGHQYLTYYSITKLAVFNWYQNKMESDTIYYANGSGGMCYQSIRDYKPGEKLIIKSDKSPFPAGLRYGQTSNSQLDSFIGEFSGKPSIEYHICDESILRYNNNKVVGNISINYNSRKRERERFLEKISKKWAEKLFEKRFKKPQKLQKMSRKRFDRIMNRKCKPNNNIPK